MTATLVSGGFIVMNLKRTTQDVALVKWVVVWVVRVVWVVWVVWVVFPEFSIHSPSPTFILLLM
jgi:hypothetical protein